MPSVAGSSAGTTTSTVTPASGSIPRLTSTTAAPNSPGPSGLTCSAPPMPSILSASSASHPSHRRCRRWCGSTSRGRTRYDTVIPEGTCLRKVDTRRVEHLVDRGAEPHQEKAAQSHEQCRSRGPSLWLIGEPDREHRQHRPAQGESAQDCASDGTFLCRDERGGGEEDSSDQSGGQRAGDDPTNVSPRPGIRVGPTVPALALGGGFGGHDGLHSLHSPAPHSWHVPSTRHEATITDPN